MFAKRGVAAFLSAVLAFGAVPPAAIAEGVAEVQAQIASIEYRINATDDDAPWVSLVSPTEAIEAAKKADEERAARAQKAAQEAEDALAKSVEQAESASEQAPANEQPNAEQVNDDVDEPANDEAVDDEMASEGDQGDAKKGDQGETPASNGNEDASDPEEPVPSEEPEQVGEVNKLEVRLAGVEGKVELRTRAAGEEWTEDWPAVKNDAGATAAEPFADLRMRLGDEAAKTYDVWYRLHVDGTWLDWVSNGEPAAPNNTTSHADDLQVLLLTKEESKLFVDTKFGTEEAPASASGTLTGQSDNQDDSSSQASDSSSSNKDAETKADSKAANSAKRDAAQVSAEAVTAVPAVSYRVHVQNQGWTGYVTNGAEAGTTGLSRRLEGINISLPAGTNGGITYQVHAQDYGWMDWVKNGEMAGTQGESKRLEAIKIQLTGAVANSFDVWYRVHAQNIGWMGWVKNGEMAGTQGESKRLESIQIILVSKGGNVPASVVGKDKKVKASITYCASVNELGWLGWMGDGDIAGTTGISATMNGFTAKLVGLNNNDLHYNAHVQNVGWQGEVTGGNTVGLPGSPNRIEAVTMRLSGQAEANYDIYYRCHVADYGWLAWASNGDKAGSGGFSKRVEAVQVMLVAKGGRAPANDSAFNWAYISVPNLRYRGHVQNVGWEGWVGNGGTAGTTGRSLRVEALQATVSSEHAGTIEIMPHVQNIGWMDWVKQGGEAGTSGRSLRVEAICVRLTDELAKYYDVWYRVHAQNIGWMGWASNGDKAGTEGLSARLEAIQIEITAKGASAPGSTSQPYIDGRNISKLGYQNPSGYYQVSSRNVKITSAARAPWNYVTPSRISVFATRAQCVNAFVNRAYEYLGTPYMWNYSCAPGVGVDCIGLVYQCAYACGMDLGGGTGTNDFNPWAHYVTGNSGWHSHDAENFWNYGRALHVPLGARQRGDVISYPGHAAIYVGNDTVVEAYTNIGVVERNMYASGSPRGVIRLFQ